MKQNLRKGDWSILPTEESKEYIRIRGTVLGGRYKIANVIDLKNHHDKSAWCKREREESKANAHLIAAAPEMYEMLNNLNQLIGWGQSESDLGNEIRREYGFAISELLKKTRGEA